MTPTKLLRATGIVVFTATALPFGPESGSAAEPQPGMTPARVVAEPFAAATESRVLVQRPGGPALDPTEGFVVLARPDGRVPRAWLWDEPLGCPRTR